MSNNKKNAFLTALLVLISLSAIVVASPPSQQNGCFANGNRLLGVCTAGSGDTFGTWICDIDPFNGDITLVPMFFFPNTYASNWVVQQGDTMLTQLTSSQDVTDWGLAAATVGTPNYPRFNYLASTAYLQSGYLAAGLAPYDSYVFAIRQDSVSTIDVHVVNIDNANIVTIYSELTGGQPPLTTSILTSIDSQIIFSYSNFSGSYIVMLKQEGNLTAPLSVVKRFSYPNQLVDDLGIQPLTGAIQVMVNDTQHPSYALANLNTDTGELELFNSVMSDNGLFASTIFAAPTQHCDLRVQYFETSVAYPTFVTFNTTDGSIVAGAVATPFGTIVSVGSMLWWYDGTP